jgi:hypothetical protein
VVKLGSSELDRHGQASVDLCLRVQPVDATGDPVKPERILARARAEAPVDRVDRDRSTQMLLNGVSDFADRPRPTVTKDGQHCPQDDRIAELLGSDAPAASTGLLGDPLWRSQKYPVLSRRWV